MQAVRLVLPLAGGVELDYNSLHALLNTPAIREDILDLISNSPQLMSKLGAFAAANGSNNKPQSVGERPCHIIEDSSKGCTLFALGNWNRSGTATFSNHQNQTDEFPRHASFYCPLASGKWRHGCFVFQATVCPRCVEAGSQSCA